MAHNGGTHNGGSAAQTLVQIVSVDGSTGGFLKDSQASAYGLTILDDADAAAAQATLALFTTGTADTPTVTATSGTITTIANNAARYFKLGKLVYWQAQWTITTNGTGAGAIRVTLPAALGNVTTKHSFALGRETAATGDALNGIFTLDQQYVDFTFGDGAYPGADGRTFIVSGWYEVA